ncbi:MAG: J domain-containing protein [Chloroflexota bacterium]
MAQTFDPYRALGVRRDATDADVKAAHRRLAKAFHPDTEGGDRDRFLRVQEAYKVLSDPLLRREWDASHAPGPMRADRTSPTAPAPRQRAPRRPARPQKQEAEKPAPETEPANRRPRSARAYTWSAAEVPWWEEGSENRRQSGRKRAARPAPRPEPTPPPPLEPAPDGPSAFDVYNRSSGAAWSMAARAYFRRGDQELPRRGTFQYEGAQVLTGARARMHAETEARRRAAQQPRRDQATAATAAGGPGAFTYATAGVSRDAQRIHQVRQAWRRRTSAATWPTLRERLFCALLAWVPAAVVIAYGSAAATGCDVARPGCPAYLETAQAISIALVLGLLVALPKFAYVGAMAAVGALFVGLGVVGIMAIAGVEVPLTVELTAVLVGALAAGYVATAAIVLLRDPSTRPWFTGARA